MTHLRRFALAALCFTTPALRAQDSLRVLRVEPKSPASPVDPVVITFDHPVAPRLDDSVDPSKLVTITPRVRSQAHWRDPSTIVITFDSVWAPGSVYSIGIVPTLRAEHGARLAATRPFTVTVRMPTIVTAWSSLNYVPADTVAHPIALYDNRVQPADLAGRVWLLLRENCHRTDSLPLTVAKIEQLSPSMYRVFRAPNDPERLRWPDSLRRLVTFNVPAVLPRGCTGELRLPAVVGAKGIHAASFQVRPRFTASASCANLECLPGAIRISFTQRVTLDEVRRNVRVNGRPARGVTGGPLEFVLEDSLTPRRTATVSVSADLRDATGERLGADMIKVLTGKPVPPSVGYLTGRVLVSKSAPTVLRIRHVNTDSVLVVIARIPESQYAPALLYSDNEYFSAIRWGDVVKDSVYRIMATSALQDVDGTLDVPASLIPLAWRDDAIVLVRAEPWDPRLVAVPGKLPTVRKPPVASPGTILTPRIAVIQRTELGLHAIRSEDDVEVWLTSLRDAAPRAGVRVRLLDDLLKPVSSAVTDARGRATLRGAPAPGKGRLALDAQDGADRAVVVLSGDEPRYDYGNDWEWTNGRARKDGQWVHAAAYTERGIYRPGERVYLGGAVRLLGRERGYVTPAGDSVQWAVKFAALFQSEVLWTDTTILTPFATTSDSMTLPRSARIGEYVAQLSVPIDGKWTVVGASTFQVAEYRAPEFAVTVDSARTDVFAGDTARVRITARYFFGQPMSGTAVTWHVITENISRWEQHPRGLSGWSVGTDATGGGNEGTGEQKGVLADDGSLVLTAPTRTATRPQRVSFFISAEDANRQTVTTSASVDVHAADAYVGLRTRGTRPVSTLRDSIIVDTKIVRASGAARVGDSLAFFVERIRYTGAAPEVDTVLRAAKMTSDSVTTFVFHPKEAGYYRVTAGTHDERGRPASSDLSLWVAGSGAVWAQRNPRAISLRLDKTAYQAGDTASLFIESPVARQQAWVSVRTQGTIGEQFARLERGLNEVRIPLPSALSPRAIIRVVATEPFEGQGDTTGVYFRVGETSVAVEEPSRELRVAMHPPRQEYAPRDTVRLGLAVTNGLGKGVRSAVTVWAVDEGVVSLTDYTRPDFLSALSAGYERTLLGSNLLSVLALQPPAVRSAFIQAYLNPLGGRVSGIRLRGASSLQLNSTVVTGAAIASDPLLRTVFRTTAFFRTVATDASGQATVSIALPDNVTRYRIYAVAVGEGIQAGSADTSVVSTLPLIVRAALPRIVRVGDSLFAGGVLTQRASTNTPAQLSLATVNADVLGHGRSSGTLDAQRPLELRFPVRITGGDSVTFRLSASTGRNADAVEARLAVSPPGRARAWVASGVIRDRASATLAVPEGTDLQRSHVALQLGASVLPYVQSLVNALRVYPYECTEQVASAGRGILARLALRRALGDSAALPVADRTQLENAINILVRRQRDDGAFGYWSSDNWSSPWLTAHALAFLADARAIGLDLPPNVDKRAQEYLRSQYARSAVQRPRRTTDSWDAWRDSLQFAHDAVASAFVLRRAGAPDTVLERDLWTAHRLLGFEDGLILVRLLTMRGDTARANELLAAAWNSARIEGRRITLDDSTMSRSWLFRSTARPYALLLEATATLQPQHPRLGALVETVLQTGRSESSRWWNTLDQSLMAEALTRATGAMGLAGARQVTISGPQGVIAQRTIEPVHVDSMQFTVSALRRTASSTAPVELQMASSVSSPTYYAMTLFEVPLARPTRADEEGIAVERWYESYRDGKPVTAVREGELVRVRLRITVPRDREFVVVDDALPAGLEAVDLSLRTSASLPPFPGAPRLTSELEEGPPGQRWQFGSWDSGWWTPWEHKEIRDDRVLYFARQLWKGSYQASYVARATTAGSFVRPPAQAEEMYNPAVRGRSDGGRFTVLPAAPER